jgi:glycine dehydrogenase
MGKESNPLKNAPYTVEDLVGEWTRPYSREAACFPAGAFRVDQCLWRPQPRLRLRADANLFKAAE